MPQSALPRLSQAKQQTTTKPPHCFSLTSSPSHAIGTSVASYFKSDIASSRVPTSVITLRRRSRTVTWHPSLPKDPNVPLVIPAPSFSSPSHLASASSRLRLRSQNLGTITESGNSLVAPPDSDHCPTPSF
ncbi:hypothetical protein VTL71DRAFT_5079, partial [Oculimacula yallundae]